MTSNYVKNIKGATDKNGLQNVTCKQGLKERRIPSRWGRESHYKLPAISNVDVNARNCETNLNSEVSDRVKNVVKVVQ